MRPAKSIREVVERLTGRLEIKAYDPKEKGRQTFKSIATDLLLDGEIRRRLGMAVRSVIQRGLKR